MTMTIKEAVDTINANPESFPNGLETGYFGVVRFRARSDLNAEVAKLREATERFVRRALALDEATSDEMHDAYSGVTAALNAVHNCWYDNFAPND